MSTVDWKNPQKRNGRTRYATTCACGNVRWLTKSDAKRAGDCFQCSQRKKAKLGYKATVAKWGYDSALIHVQAYLLDNPSKGEQAIIQALARSGHQFEREVIFARDENHKALLDFVVYGRYVIEFNGGCHINHRERDLYKFNAIRSAGYQLLVLEDHDLGDLDTILGEFLIDRTPVTSIAS